MVTGPQHKSFQQSTCTPMGIFKPDFYRSFAIGFALGAAVLLGVKGFTGGFSLANQVIPTAEAAPALPDQTL